MSQPESFAKCICQNCGGRLEFPVQGAGQKITCPHCNWPTLLFVGPAPVEVGGGPSVRRRIFTLFCIAAVLVGAAGAGAYFYLQSLDQQQEAQQQVATPARPVEHSNATPAAAAPVQPPKRKPPSDPWHGLKASDVTLEKTEESHLIYAIGILTNNSTRQRFGVKVELELQDGHRNKLGSATDYTDLIEPGKEWKFRALVTAKNATAVKLKSVKEQE